MPLRHWLDSRIVLITGHAAPKFTPEEIGRLRLFVLNGGTIFSCTEGDGKGFKDGIRALYGRLFPQYKLIPCGRNHEIRSLSFILPRPLALHELSNGVRPLAIHCDEDLPLAWQLNQGIARRASFQAAANIVLYVTDRHPYDGRFLDIRRWPAEPKFTPKLTVTLARLKHAGNFDPEPLAYERFRRLMGRDLQVRVNIAGPMPIADLPKSGAAVAVLSGMGPLTLGAAEEQALKQFVARGGTLVVEAAGGRKEFTESAEQLVEKLFGRPRRLPATCPIYRIKGLEIGEVTYTRRARWREGMAGRQPRLCGATVNSRLAVLLSREDITTGLLGLPSHGVIGYRPDSAFALMRNLVLHAAGAKKKP
jgi:hypothetical protein